MPAWNGVALTPDMLPEGRRRRCARQVRDVCVEAGAAPPPRAVAVDPGEAGRLARAVAIETISHSGDAVDVNRVPADKAVVCHPGLQSNRTDIRFRNVVKTPL
jgi:hypothetical protein